MLGDKEAMASVAVKDLAVARKFYEQTLGLNVVNAAGSEAITFKGVGSKIVVYRSQYAGTNQATALNFSVGADIASIVRGLKDRGVAFEHYDMPGVSHEGDVHAFGDFKTAWFKDPDGNIIALMTG